MFSLVSGFIEYMTRKDEFHILILGIDNAGKTNLLERLKTLFTDHLGLDSSKILPTVGLNVGRVEAFGCSLIFWDLGGQIGLRSIWDKYYSETHALIFVVDAADPARLAEAKQTLTGVLGNPELEGAPLLVLANKQDLEAAAPAAQVAEQLAAEELQGRTISAQGGSALTGQGVHDALKWLIEAIKKSPRRAQIAARDKKSWAG